MTPMAVQLCSRGRLYDRSILDAMIFVSEVWELEGTVPIRASQALRGLERALGNTNSVVSSDPDQSWADQILCDT